MQFSADYLSKIKYDILYNILRINGNSISKANITMITNNVYVDLGPKSRQLTMIFLKNTNLTIDACFSKAKNKQIINEELMNFIVDGILKNISEFDFNNESYVALIKKLQTVDWKQLTLHQFNENLADITMDIMNHSIFADYSETICLVLFFLFPLFYKMHPIVVEFKDIKALKNAYTDQNKSELLEIITIIQNRGEDEYKKIEMS